MSMLKVDNVTHWSIPVNNLEEAEHFYRDVLGPLCRGAPLVAQHSEPGLCRRIVHMGYDSHHTTRLGLREDGPCYSTACSGLGGSNRCTPGPSWLHLKRHRDTINRSPL